MLKKLLDSLKAEDRGAILFAFEHGVTYFVEYQDGRFFGVNTDSVPHLQAETKVGVWREGKVVK